MHIRPNTVVIDDEHVPAATAAGSAEPMRRADHKSKKHPRPARKSETLGGVHQVGAVHLRRFRSRTMTTTVQSIIVNELGDALRFTAELAALVAAGGALLLWVA